MRVLLLFPVLFFFGCQNSFQSELIELSDAENPDHPYLHKRHSLYNSIDLKELKFEKMDSLYTLTLVPTSLEDDVLEISTDLLEFMPTIPSNVKGDLYLEKISLLNQEWNRNQVRYYDFNEKSLAGLPISRVDLARNCLNAYLWEILIYTGESEDLLYHGWFNFPKELYANLYKERNKEEFNTRADFLENWKDPESELIDFNYFRNVISEDNIKYEVRNNEMYPLKGERELKRKLIISPLRIDSINDLLTDSTTFATFSPPGIYRRAEPRKTELSRFKKLVSLKKKTIRIKGAETNEIELELIFDSPKHGLTKLRLGGLNINNLPFLKAEEANKGQMYSMGIANHPFYESYTEHLGKSSKTNPYYGLLTDKDNRFLDSHKIGIDGPLLHFDEDKKLHLWLLAFERQALIGHYIIEF